MENKVERKNNIIVGVGSVIVILGVLINLALFIPFSKESFWMFSLYLSSPMLYYMVEMMIRIPVGTLFAGIVGNKKTGFITFALTGVVFILKAENTNLLISFAAAVICALVYESKLFNRLIRGILSAFLTCAAIIGISVSMGVLPEPNKDMLGAFSLLIVVTIILVLIFGPLELLPTFMQFDMESKDLDRNYRVHSINNKLMRVINVVCIAMIIAYAAVSLSLLMQKEEQNRLTTQRVWEAVFYNAVLDDAEIYSNHDMELIKKEADKLREALSSGSIDYGSYIYVTTNINEKYVQQYYLVSEPTDYSMGRFKVEWSYEYTLTEEQVNNSVLLPAEGNSSLNVFLVSNAKKFAIEAIEKMIALAVVLMAFMNIIAEGFIRKYIVKPINQMTTEVVNFAYGEKGNEDKNHKQHEIKTGDEIESLNQAFHKTMEDMNEYIEDVERKSKQVSDMQHNIIITMADIIESRDLSTGGHIKRTAVYVEIIAKRLMEEGMFTDTLTQDYLNDMTVAAPLHDMGKIHVPDQILNKNGRLTDEEFAIMKTHAEVGKDLLNVAEESLGEFKYLMVAKQMAESHHEWWNGNGYPNKISGEEIPLCARIMAVADVFDALVSKRCYKDPMDLDVAFDIIEKETGTHFDPVVGKAFLESRKKVEEALRELTQEEG